MRYAFVIALLLAAVAKADTLLISTANFNDLNPERDATNAVSFETIRITHTITDGADLLPLTAATSMPLYIELAAGGWTTAVYGATSTNSPGVVRWQIPGGLNAGDYRLRGWVFFPDDSFTVYDRFLTVTSTPAQAGTVNIASGAVQVAVSGGITIDLLDIKSQSITNSGDMWIGGTLYAGGLDIAGEIQALDTGAVRRVGDTMLGGLTNEAGFFGDGAGLTNLPTGTEADPIWGVSSQWYGNAISAGRLWGGNVSVTSDTIYVAAGGGLCLTDVVSTLSDIPVSLQAGFGSPPVYVTWDATNMTALAGYNIVYFDYSAGVMTNILKADFFTYFNVAQDFTVGRTYYDTLVGGISRLCGMNAWSHQRRNQIYHDLKAAVEVVQGGVPSASGLKLAVTAARLVAEGYDHFTTVAHTTNTLFSYWYQTNSVWTFISTNVIDNLNWNEITEADGLTALTANRWRSDYIYLTHNGSVHVTMGRMNSGNAATAQAVAIPVPPDVLAAYGTLIGRITIQKSATTMTVDPESAVGFSASSVPEHNDLGGLQGGAAGDYYHLTAAELAIATNPASGSGITGLTASADSAGVVAAVDASNWTVGTNLTGVGGGLTLWVESTGSATQAGTDLTPVSMPYNTASNRTVFFGDNGSFSIRTPDGGANNGAARGANAIDIQTEHENAVSVASGDESIAISSRSTVSGDLYDSVFGGYNHVISGSGYNTAVGGSAALITSGDDYNTVIGSRAGTISGDGAGLFSGSHNYNYIANSAEGVIDKSAHALILNDAARSRITNSTASFVCTTLYGSNVNSKFSGVMLGQRSVVNASTNALVLMGDSNRISGVENSVILQGNNQTLTDSGRALVGDDLQVGGNLWLGTNAYFAVDASTTNLLWITLTPPTTNLIGVTPL